MAVEVIQSDRENKIARAEMRRRDIDFTSSMLLRIARKLNIINSLNIGDYCKSWDVLKTIQFIENTCALETPILDIGACGSEILCSLHRIGYTNLTGVDLNPRLINMPYADKIKYVISDFMRMPFKDHSFSTVTAISVIEHGFDPQRLLGELVRVLKPGGYFIASVDYWPEKINTSNISAYNMEWTIFSEKELTDFIEEAREYGFRPVGTLNTKASEPIICWNGKQYTFAWFALQKIMQ